MEEDFDTLRFPASPPETPADFYGNTTGGSAGTAVHHGGPERPLRGGPERPPGGMADRPPYGGLQEPPGGLAENLPYGGIDEKPPGMHDTNARLGAANTRVHNALHELDIELEAMRARLRTLSMRRSKRVRADIHEALSDSSPSPSDTVINAPKRNVTRQPPRSATVCEGEKVKVKSLPQSNRYRRPMMLFCRVCLILSPIMFVGEVIRRIQRPLPLKTRLGWEMTRRTLP